MTLSLQNAYGGEDGTATSDVNALAGAGFAAILLYGMVTDAEPKC